MSKKSASKYRPCILKYTSFIDPATVTSCINGANKTPSNVIALCNEECCLFSVELFCNSRCVHGLLTFKNVVNVLLSVHLHGCNGYNGGWPSARLFGWSAADWSRPATNTSISSERNRKSLVFCWERIPWTIWLLTFCSKKCWAAEKSSKMCKQKGKMFPQLNSMVLAK